jgi:hypothetical protein
MKPPILTLFGGANRLPNHHVSTLASVFCFSRISDRKHRQKRTVSNLSQAPMVWGIPKGAVCLGQGAITGDADIGQNGGIEGGEAHPLAAEGKRRQNPAREMGWRRKAANKAQDGGGHNKSLSCFL